MAEDIRLWEIGGDKKLKEIDKSDLKKAGYKEEDDLESWIENDISLISDDLLIIGRQIRTLYGGEIDLLCLDRNGNLVILELKRDRTPREVTAQVLDYASWVKDLSYDDIVEIGGKYFKEEQSLESAFRETFDEGLPDTLNETHRMMIVASEMDDETERIIRYLSEVHGVDINFIKFQFFKNAEGKELLARVFLIAPEEVEHNVGAKRIPKRSIFSIEVGRYGENELKDLMEASLTRESDLTPRLVKFIEILLSEDRVFDREEVKGRLFSEGIGTDIGQTGRYLSNISQFLTKRDNSHLRQVVEFSSGGLHGQIKDNYKIRNEYRDLVRSVCEQLGNEK